MGDWMEKRKFQRVAVKGFEADISDGIGFFPGEMIDISRDGMLMVDLPKRLDERTFKMTVVVSGEGSHFKMLVRPRWSSLDGMRKTVGFEIMNTPWEWTEFVMGYEPKVEKDVWGEAHL